MRLLHLFRATSAFIALSASSPFPGVDTAFASSRLNNVSAFPLAGHMPQMDDWAGFTEYFEQMRQLQVVESMKDFYWDIRPKPEFGTIEVRVCDTPLTLERAAALAAYAQALARWLLEEKPLEPSADVYRVYGYNRFLACRFGLDAEIIDPYERASACWPRTSAIRWARCSASPTTRRRAPPRCCACARWPPAAAATVCCCASSWRAANR